MPWPGDLQLSQLELFLRLADAGSLSAAARQVQVTPAAASATLKRLEALLEVRLVERSTRSLRLTPEGELLREHAQQALGVLDDAKTLLGAQREQLEGEIHLAAPSDLGRSVIAPMLEGFLGRHPRVRLAMHISDGMHDLKRDRIDLAVRAGTLPDSSLVARLLHSTPRVLVASPAYLAARGAPEHPGELARHDCISLYLRGQAQLQWTLWHGADDMRVKVQGTRRADDGALVRQWAVEGFGIALKARLDVHADLQAGRLVRVLPQWRGELMPLHAVLPSGRHVPLRVRRLLDELSMRFASVEGATVAAPSTS